VGKVQGQAIVLLMSVACHSPKKTEGKNVQSDRRGTTHLRSQSKSRCHKLGIVSFSYQNPNGKNNLLG
jgi:hypothetical protein